LLAGMLHSVETFSLPISDGPNLFFTATSSYFCLSSVSGLFTFFHLHHFAIAYSFNADLNSNIVNISSLFRLASEVLLKGVSHLQVNADPTTTFLSSSTKILLISWGLLIVRLVAQSYMLLIGLIYELKSKAIAIIWRRTTYYTPPRVLQFIF